MGEFHTESVTGPSVWSQAFQAAAAFARIEARREDPDPPTYWVENIPRLGTDARSWVVLGPSSEEMCRFTNEDQAKRAVAALEAAAEYERERALWAFGDLLDRIERGGYTE